MIGGYEYKINNGLEFYRNSTLDDQCQSRFGTGHGYLTIRPVNDSVLPTYRLPNITVNGVLNVVGDLDVTANTVIGSSGSINLTG